MKKEYMRCCFCNNEFVSRKDIWNPFPFSEEGRCCTLCYQEKVIPRRLFIAKNITKARYSNAK